MRQISVGQLRHRITVQYLDPEAGEDDYGVPIPAWKTLGQLWAKVEPLTGREFFAAAQTQSEVTHRITCRWHPGWRTEPGAFITPAQLVPQGEQVGITPTARIMFGSRIFDIVAPPKDLEERHIWLEILCREKVS